ncbi:unnamed protein product [Didymodactylos carnosus]|uniref:RNA-binding protein 25 n=1 Tax=Didymodactylos carnosus TaxID=1234261 RepID=A0A814BCY6_9BILA|nr:unnamed protein product [Didymodactylos carnosus]CAF0924322.1 unnamed protein product [Didymodactylos carnosus]CAF3556694.1 unnamed protein product [Didymodactylos carnosus]CAF3703251.1 unnamed protein product [Didymodactylos carnosus]
MPVGMVMPTNIEVVRPVASTTTPSSINGGHSKQKSDNEKSHNKERPPTTTVFVGNISDRAPDAMIKRMLQHCGGVINWKRVQGANGKLQAFGFCEYENPEGTLRCIRLLNGWQIADKQLVVKVDAKTKSLLDEYKKKKRHENAKKAANDTTAYKFVYEPDTDDEDKKSPTKSNSNQNSASDGSTVKKSGEEGEIEEEEEEVDIATKNEDKTIVNSLDTVMREYAREIAARTAEAKEKENSGTSAVTNLHYHNDKVLNHHNHYNASNAYATNNLQQATSSTTPVTPATSVTATTSAPSSANGQQQQQQIFGKSNNPALNEIRVDDEKRDLVTNEIKMFRDKFKDEDAKMRVTEKERKDRYDRERQQQREKEKDKPLSSPTRSPPGKATTPTSSHRSSKTSSNHLRDERSSERALSPIDDYRSPSSSRRRDVKPDRSIDDRYSSRSDYNRSSVRDSRDGGSRHSGSLRRPLSPPRRPDPRDRGDKAPVSKLPSGYSKRSRSNSPEVSAIKNSKTPEDEEEAYQRKKQERRLREKELRYRDRLKAWEGRERKKEVEYEAERRRELARLREEEKEGKRLLAFLEDYSDEKDDIKFYKGTALARRLKEREHEIEIDNRDRYKEKEELEELRQKLTQQNIDDVEGELKRRVAHEEDAIRRCLAELTHTHSDSSTTASTSNSENEDEKDEKGNKKIQDVKVEKDMLNTMNITNPPSQISDTKSSSIDPENMDLSSGQLGKNSTTVAQLEDISQSPGTATPPPPLPGTVLEIIFLIDSPRHPSIGGVTVSGTKLLSKRKLTVNEAFLDDQEENSPDAFAKKSKLTILEQQTQPSSSSTLQQPSTPPSANNNRPLLINKAPASTDERRQAVRKLIESIPTKKEDLFAFSIDWSLLDSSLMEKRIKPWVTKKIIEYIGEEEPTLTDFICTSIMSKQNAESILSDIRVVLDDEAEIFVVKMWRLLVYEIEAKRHGLSK